MFYDDNEWVGLAKVQLHLQTRDSAALVRAREIFDLVRSGWDTDSTHAAPGGVFWTQANWSQDRNTVSNMPGAQLALRLHQITGEDGYLDWARRFYDWTNTYLQSPGALYWDHLDLKGTVEKTIWSYNQGVPVGVNVLLYKATHDRTYLRRAERIAQAAYAYYVTQGRLFTQPVYFNSIFFKNLLLLESVTGDGKYHQAMADYADELWSTMRDPGTGLVHFDSSGGTEAIQQAAFAQLYAVLAWPRGLWPTLY
jgi:predicted alpha-1,6-mannanase (GH76 family)